MAKRYRQFIENTCKSSLNIWGKNHSLVHNNKNANSNCAKIVFVTYQTDNQLSLSMCMVGNQALLHIVSENINSSKPVEGKLTIFNNIIYAFILTQQFHF